MTARPRTRRRHPEPSRDAPNYNSHHALRERLGPASACNGHWTTFPGVQSGREKLVPFNRKKGTLTTKLTPDWLVLARRCRLRAELYPTALLRDGGSVSVWGCQKRPDVDRLRGTTQRILVSVQVKRKVG